MRSFCSQCCPCLIWLSDSFSVHCQCMPIAHEEHIVLMRSRKQQGQEGKLSCILGSATNPHGTLYEKLSIAIHHYTIMNLALGLRACSDWKHNNTTIRNMWWHGELYILVGMGWTPSRDILSVVQTIEERTLLIFDPTNFCIETTYHFIVGQVLTRMWSLPSWNVWGRLRSLTAGHTLPRGPTSSLGWSTLAGCPAPIGKFSCKICFTNVWPRVQVRKGVACWLACWHGRLYWGG